MMDPSIPKNPRLVGIISDTHGVLRPEAVEALRGSDLIVHAGDIGDGEGPQVLAGLRALAPLIAVRGNCDRDAWALELPVEETFEVGGLMVHVLHDLARLDFLPQTAGIAVVISGHTHRPRVDRKDGVLYINPGSAGQQRFDLPVSLARLNLARKGPQAEIVKLLK
jgi:putative phosphoesterase